MLLSTEWWSKSLLTAINDHLRTHLANGRTSWDLPPGTVSKEQSLVSPSLSPGHCPSISPQWHPRDPRRRWDGVVGAPSRFNFQALHFVLKRESYVLNLTSGCVSTTVKCPPKSILSFFYLVLEHTYLHPEFYRTHPHSTRLLCSWVCPGDHVSRMVCT